MSRTEGAALWADHRQEGTICAHCRAPIGFGDQVMKCRACGGLSHASCWDLNVGCGSFACAPASRPQAEAKRAAGAIVITASELDRANLAQPPATAGRTWPLAGTNGSFSASEADDAARPRSVAAVWSLALALLGLIPGVGLIAGFAAILTGAYALASMQKRKRRGGGFAAAGILLGLADVLVSAVFIVGYLAALGSMKVELNFSDKPPAEEDLRNYPPAIERAMRANVMVRTKAGWGGIASAFGSGVILAIENGEALVVTNRHVVDHDFAFGGGKGGQGKKQASELEVQMIGQGFTPAAVEWTAPGDIDLALVRVPVRTKAARAALWKPKTRAEVGDSVFAVGNPQMLGWTLTKGSLSAFRTQEFAGRKVRVIQTQTAINQGNSGGGLYTADGELIGINTWTSDKTVSEGLSFALAFDSLLELAPPMLKPAPQAEEQKP